MKFIRIGDRFINLDHVVEIDAGRGELARVFFDVPSEEGFSFETFEGDAAEALRDYFASLVANGTVPDLMSRDHESGNVPSESSPV